MTRRAVYQPFPVAARLAVNDAQLRRNIGAAVHTIRAKRGAAVGEVEDWEQLRLAAEAIKRRTLRHLPHYLERLEQSVVAAGGQVHWASDAAEANRIVTGIVSATGARAVVKVKSMVSDEIGLNQALAKVGVRAIETDLAELIVALAHDRPSHILVPAIHRNRGQIREIFLAAMPGVDPELSDDPRELAMAARAYLRQEFLSARVAISGANFACADNGSVVVLESEGNGRMCLTLPRTLVTVMGIEKVIPSVRDLEVFLQLLPRSSTGERMNPYTSIWRGVSPGDGPEEFHLVLLDNGRARVLSDPVTRPVLACIRCSACLNVCPVYERTGGHAYGSVYPGPIGAVLVPSMLDPHELPSNPHVASLPFASSLCGACFEVCPVRIDIPRVLVHLRARTHGEGAERPDGRRVTAQAAPDRAARRWRGTGHAERAAMWAAAFVMRDSRRLGLAQRLGARAGDLLLPLAGRVPGPAERWSDSHELPNLPRQSFRAWWKARGADSAGKAPLR